MKDRRKEHKDLCGDRHTIGEVARFLGKKIVRDYSNPLMTKISYKEE